MPCPMYTKENLSSYDDNNKKDADNTIEASALDVNISLAGEGSGYNRVKKTAIFASRNV